MPNIHEKGVHVPTWMASIVFGLVCTLLGWMFTKQSTINEVVLDRLTELRVQQSLELKDKIYIERRVEKLEGENTLLKDENERQDREIEKLKQLNP